MSRPSSTTRPSSAVTYPLMRSKSVVLPAPFGPIMPTISPLPTANDTSSTAWLPPNERLEPGDLERGIVAAATCTAEHRAAAARRRR